GYQQNERHGAQQHPQPAAHIAAHNLFIDTHKICSGIPIVIRELLRQAFSDAGQVGLRLFEAHSMLQTSNRLQNLRAMISKDSALARNGGQDLVLFKCQGELKRGRKNADNGKRLTIQRELLTQRRIVSPKTILPELIAQNDYWLGAALLFFGLK